MKLQTQARKIIDEIGIPVSTFCRKVKISDSAFYRWQHDDLRLSEETEQRIKEYINKLSRVF